MPEDERLITPKEFRDRLGISRSTFYRWICEGKVPKPVKISERIHRWRNSDVIKTIDTLTGQAV